jgi:hypothetical protein
MSNEADTTEISRTTPGARLAVTAVIVGAIVAVVAVAVVRAASGDEQVPYDDPASSGLLTLCDSKGNQITGGKVTDKPLAATVLGETPLDSRVSPDAVAIGTLYGYQPRQGVESLEFSGAPIGGPVDFADHARPATRVVKDGYSLAEFTSIYPAQFDGYIQLRLITSVDGFGAFNNAYDTADIVIDGDRWEVARGGNASCAQATSRFDR